MVVMAVRRLKEGKAFPWNKRAVEAMLPSPTATTME
jgi:hypothetical protein